MEFGKTYNSLLSYVMAVNETFVAPWHPAIDPRTEKLILVGNVYLMLAILLAYFLFVLVLGPAWMRTRTAWNVSRPMQVYNSLLTALSLYMAIELPLAAHALRLSPVCSPVSLGFSPEEHRLARIIWIYYFSKFIELLDTVFMVLRKKTSQITVLHVYHHSTIILFWWVTAAYLPGGVSFSLPILNCTIHVFMYAYYFLASLGPAMRSYLWWKRYLTVMQIGQFLALIVHCGIIYVSDCGYPRRFGVITGCYLLSLLVLFLAFYRTTYSKPSKKE